MTKLMLPLHGPSRLVGASGPVRVQRRGLALLYYLAVNGPARREHLADLLWGRRRALSNLRVEVHGLRRALREFRIDAFPSGEDPLTLPDGIRLDEGPRAGDAMEGLEGLSSEFDTWLQYQQIVMSGAEEPGQIAFSEQITDLAEEMRAPFVVFLEGLPFSGRATMARQLAARLDMPFQSGPDGQGSLLRYLPDSIDFDEVLVSRIASDRSSVWVVARSAFGEDPRLLLRLRELIPVDRTRYVTMPRLSWHQACSGLLADVPEEEASKLYLASGGLLGYLEELLLMRPAQGFGGDIPIPQRVLARVKIEARRLSAEARLAAETLSVHPFGLPDSLIDELGLRTHLVELERRRWLRFDGGWSFASEAVRKILYGQLPPGRRSEVHRVLAAHFEQQRRERLARFHLLRAAPDKAHRPKRHADRGRSLPPSAAMSIGSVRRVEEPDEARGLVWTDARAWLPAQPDQPTAHVRIDIPGGADVARIEGSVRWNGRYRDDEESHLLDVKLRGSVERTIAFTPSAHPGVGPNGTLRIPASEDGRLDLWFRVDDFAFLEIRTDALDMVGSFSVAFARIGRDGSTVTMTVPVYDLLAREPSEAL